MNWFQQNRFLGMFLAIFGGLAIASLVFLFWARSGFMEAKARFDENAMELNRLQRLTPFPNDEHLEKMKTQAEGYAADLKKLKDELEKHVLPAPPLAPNEFQARLRAVVTSLTEKAKANGVKLPENFYLGFEEFASALPDTAAAPALGQQLAQAELLVNILLEARVESITAFKRVPPTEASLAPPTPTPAVARKPGPAAKSTPAIVERSVVEAAFVSAPGALRRVLNQVSTAKEQFYIIRTLHILNEQDKGPPREVAAAEAGSTPAPAPAPSPAPGPDGKPGSNAALNFIVGTERVQTAARIEMLRFVF